MCHPLPATCGRFPSPKMGEGLKSITYKGLSLVGENAVVPEIQEVEGRGLKVEGLPSVDL